LADVAMHSCICSVTGVCILADKAIHSYICSVTSVCIYTVYKHVAPTFSDRYQSSTIDLLLCSTHSQAQEQTTSTSKDSQMPHGVMISTAEGRQVATCTSCVVVQSLGRCSECEQRCTLIMTALLLIISR
jgi:hypothetical protein